MNINKKSEAGIAIVLTVVIIIVFLGWVINVNQRECRSNRDCGDEAYCGSDFSCHSYPTIQKTVVQYNFLMPSVIIGIAIILAAAILKWNIKPKEEPSPHEEVEIPREAEEISEPYYNSDAKIKTP